MKAIYKRQGVEFAAYVLDGTCANAEAIRVMVWSTAGLGWDWVIV